MRWTPPRYPSRRTARKPARGGRAWQLARLVSLTAAVLPVGCRPATQVEPELDPGARPAFAERTTEMPQLRKAVAEIEARMEGLERASIASRTVPPDAPRSADFVESTARGTTALERIRLELEVQRLQLLLQGQHVVRAVAERSALWSPATLEVCWEASATPFPTEQAWVESAAQGSWPAVSGVILRGWNECGPTGGSIRIGVNNTGEAETLGVGSQLAGVHDGMTLRFDFSDWNRSCADDRELCIRSIAVHEFGHALGLTHEQNRTDPENPAWCHSQRQGSSGDWAVTIYDPDSIMNRCREGYLKDPSLSDLDIEAIRTLYPS